MFHSQTDHRLHDEEGVDLPGPVEARHEAVRLVGEMIKEAPAPFWGSRPWNVTVTDGSGLILWEVFVDGVASPATANLG